MSGLAVSLGLLVGALGGWANETHVSVSNKETAAVPGTPGKIQDNSFLIEEAYNQEAGVIQHIQNLQYMHRDGTWLYTFTEEWPAPKQDHQLSATVPVVGGAAFDNHPNVSDIALNYRYQAVNIDHITLAPRLSLLLPTGDYHTGAGTGSFGVQTNIPISVELNPFWTTHWNLGATYTPSARSMSGVKGQTLSVSYGASAIWLPRETLNIMLEVSGASYESIGDDGSAQRRESVIVNPGIRYALNYRSGLQVVPGLAVPVGVGPSAGDYGVYTYLSFEHPMF